MKKKATWLLVSAALATSVAGIVLGRKAAARRLRRDVERLFAQLTDVSTRIYHESQLEGLPAPVQRYFRHVLRDGQPYLRGLRLRHGGQFKTDLEGDWIDIKGEEYLVADPPGFIWQGTTRQFIARDEYVGGRGSLTVRLLGAVPIMRGAGPHYDQGELLRWLGESTWLPTNLLPSERVSWAAVDDQSARLTLTHEGQTVAYLVRFNEQNEIEQCETQRYQGDQKLLPWIGRSAQYREIQGVRVPTVLEGAWVADGKRQPYAHFIVQELSYGPLQPF
ncbi:DUF6544 family protein [Hymenobacter jejuensis]|uniref:Uncharacterized protein n=1 Tax=Hymenobacter jejuensis TaxID=2502781 RepID=A0A5B8A0Y6_9BACT|nr:DUF6544 family protein [Hymenobacter jejuensis]QDA61061.1 hypothetical protein FHG12_13525 [Hymenobacter jejuensis]